MQKSFWLIMILVVVGMIGLFVLTSDNNSANSAFKEYDPAKLQLTDHIDGIEVTTQADLDTLQNEKVILVEYGDYQCPACAYFSQVLDQIKTDYGDQLVAVFRNFPLTSIHPQSMAAHRAAEAAAKQGKYWEMHDILYARQDQWSGITNVAPIFEGYASELGLDLDQFATDRDSTEVFDRISLDRDSADIYNISATPTLVVNGTKLDQTPSYDDLKTLIDNELAVQNN